METHIKRRHGGRGQPIHKTPYGVFESPSKPMANNLLGDFRKPSSVTTNSDPIDWQTLRKIKEMYELRSLLAASGLWPQPMNIGLPYWGTLLGLKGHVCKKCMSFEFKCIFDDVERISLKPNHTCYPQRLFEAQFVADVQGTVHKRKGELISWLTFIVNQIARQQELVDLTAVEIPATVFDSRLDSYEEYIDLDSLQSLTLDWAYRAAKGGKTMINRSDLAEFLDIFEATLGFFRLTINEVKRYFFVYIANGLEPRDIKSLKLLRVESPAATEIGMTMNYFGINKEWKDIFMDGPLTSIPPLRPDKINFLLQNPTTSKPPNISKKEIDEIRERQENAYKKNLMYRR